MLKPVKELPEWRPIEPSAMPPMRPAESLPPDVQPALGYNQSVNPAPGARNPQKEVEAKGKTRRWHEDKGGANAATYT